MSRPLVVLPLDGDPNPAVRKATADGWRPERSLDVPEEPWDLGAARHLAVASIETAESAAAALLLAVRGAGLVVFLDPDAPWAGGFLADLDRIDTPAPDIIDAGAGAGAAIPLSDEQCALLDLLAAGASIASAAASLYVSLRTANRRIAEARKALGAASTSEAVVAYSRLRERN
jgi:DNA-binding CsgD family transcriptional regulator